MYCAIGIRQPRGSRIAVAWINGRTSYTYNCLFFRRKITMEICRPSVCLFVIAVCMMGTTTHAQTTGFTTTTGETITVTDATDATSQASSTPTESATTSNTTSAATASVTTSETPSEATDTASTPESTESTEGPPGPTTTPPESTESTEGPPEPTATAGPQEPTESTEGPPGPTVTAERPEPTEPDAETEEPPESTGTAGPPGPTETAEPTEPVGTRDTATTVPTTPPDRKEFEGDLRITQIDGEEVEFTSEYEDSTSQPYRDLSEQVCTAVVAALESSTVGSDIEECSVSGFSAGSIVAAYIMAFPLTTEDISETLVTDLKQAFTNSTDPRIAFFEVDISSITVKEVISSTVQPETGLSGGAIAGIVIGSVAGVALLVVVIVFLVKKLGPSSKVADVEEQELTRPSSGNKSPPPEHQDRVSNASEKSSSHGENEES